MSPKSNAEHGRFWAAFFVLAVTFAAAIFSLLFLLWPVSVKAQTQPICFSVWEAVDQAEDAEHPYEYLTDEMQVRFYTQSIFNLSSPPGADGTSLFVIKSSTSEGWRVYPVRMGTDLVCLRFSHLVSDSQHEQAMHASIGQAI